MDSPISVEHNYPGDEWLMVETHQNQQLGSQSSYVIAPTNDTMMVDSNPQEEIFDGCFRIDSFFQLYEVRLWYKIDVVRVHYVWKDTQENKLYLFLLDKHRDIIAAIVPKRLIQFYEGRSLVGRVFSMSFFHVDRSDPYVYARFEHYTFVRANHVININQQTQLTEITNGEHNNFAKYPTMPFIKYLVEDRTPRRMMTDVIGKVSKGYFMGYPHPNGQVSLFLRDWSGSEVRLILNHCATSHLAMLARAIKEQGIVYAARVKLIHHATGNYLESTPLTVIEFNPDMDETTYIGRFEIPVLPHLMIDEFNPEMLGLEFLERLHI